MFAPRGRDSTLNISTEDTESDSHEQSQLLLKAPQYPEIERGEVLVKNSFTPVFESSEVLYKLVWGRCCHVSVMLDKVTLKKN
jgi:hypothetical protein